VTMPELLYKAGPFIVGAIFAAILIPAFWNYWYRGESRRWPKVQGKILTARIVNGYTSDENDRREEYFEVEVRYKYQVRGTAYVGTRYSFGQDRYSNYEGAMEALHGIAAGREVPVYYDPSHPQRAVLRKG
jgi:hypothetical protein